MEKRQLGKTDMAVTVLGYGGAEVGFQNESAEKVSRILNAALDAGLNAIDTAECYNASEDLIGKAVAQRRSEYYLFTKCGHGRGDDLPAMDPPLQDWDPRLLELTIDRSLKRLRTDYVDILQLHTCSEELLRQGDVIAIAQKARDAGKARYIGYSGDSKAARYAVECGAFDTLQTSISIADQEALDLTLPLARERQMGVIVKRPIANACWRSGSKPENGYLHTYWDRLQELDYDFLRGDLDAAISTALRFTLSSPGVTTAIVGTANPDRWRANAQLLEAGPLPAEQYEAIRARWRAMSRPEWTGQA